MKEILCEKNFNTPEVLFDLNEKKLIIQGVCTPENPKLFFEPIINRVKEINALNTAWVMEIALNYFNSATNIVLLNILSEAQTEGLKNNFRVRWYYDDSESKESGVLLEELSHVPFEFVPM